MQAIKSVNTKGSVKKLQIGHNAKDNKQKETRPSRVRNGKTEEPEASHFSLGFLIPHANILVYKK